MVDRPPFHIGKRLAAIDRLSEDIEHAREDFPADGHWSTYKGYAPIKCDKCYYACRGEAQMPMRPNRFLDLVASL